MVLYSLLNFIGYHCFTFKQYLGIDCAKNILGSYSYYQLIIVAVKCVLRHPNDRVWALETVEVRNINLF